MTKLIVYFTNGMKAQFDAGTVLRTFNEENPVSLMTAIEGLAEKPDDIFLNPHTVCFMRLKEVPDEE